MNMVEIQLQRNFAPANLVKEYREGYEIRGNARNLYYTTTVKSNFNFFENLMRWDDLHQTPITSPISGSGNIELPIQIGGSVRGGRTKDS